MRRFIATALNPTASSVLYEHAPGVVCNCTRLPQGRALLTEGAAGDGLSALVDTLKSESDVRRTGAAAAVKNVVMAAHQDGTFSKVLQDTERLRRMMVRCCGATWKNSLSSWHVAQSRSLCVSAEQQS